jgi:diaminohydroxyphosphoribosylaminopyrimidine deaminase / 5-amino-6-(5-phosphoribosylamino)uracil reductase
VPVKGDVLSTEQAQALALSEAEKGAGWVSPNPLVGCVVVDQQHRFLASGFHGYYGGPHAERDAFAKIDSGLLQGATVYVTLEPCSHQGKTPPCTDLFLKQKISKVVMGQKDPNPLVAGRGLAILQRENITVATDEAFSKKSARLAEMFLWHMQNKKPYVTLKVALSADGKIAGPLGSNPAITSEAARFRARELRATYDATFIGAETFLRDNPLLDFRGTRWEGKKQPKVVILDPRGRAQAFLSQSRLAQTVKSENVFFVASVDETMLRDLYQKGIYSLYVEGGAKTHELFIQQKLYQKLICFVSPTPCVEGLSWLWTLETLKAQLHLVATVPIGEDQCFEFEPT